jgi:hypothetical protein
VNSNVGHELMRGKSMNRIRAILVVFVAAGAFAQAPAPVDPYWEAASSAMDKDFVGRNAEGLTDSDVRLLAAYTNFAEPLPSPLPPEQKLANVMAKVRMATVLSATETTVEWMAGHYSNPGPSMNSSIFGSYAHDVSDLYLFPDSTYIYLRWGGQAPRAIYGKGTWAVSNSVVRLCDDRAIQASGYGADPYYMALVLTNTVLQRYLTNVAPRRVVLLAAGFLQQPLEDPWHSGGRDREMALLMAGLERERGIGKKETETLRRKLLAECWRPDYFGIRGGHGEVTRQTLVGFNPHAALIHFGGAVNCFGLYLCLNIAIVAFLWLVRHCRPTTREQCLRWAIWAECFLFVGVVAWVVVVLSRLHSASHDMATREIDRAFALAALVQAREDIFTPAILSGVLGLCVTYFLWRGARNRNKREE